MYKDYLKPFLDRLLGILAALFLLPLMTVIFFLILVKNRTWPFFIQPRAGLHEKVFNIIKFKTMSDEKDASGNFIADDLRITKIGNFLRKSSLDELPEIFNIILGHMSFVGPRPLLEEYLSSYNSQQRKRHNVKPGVTGLAQVNGRNLITWDEKFSYDLKYVEDISFKNDCLIILKTVFIIFNTNSVNTSENKIMKKFEGSDLRKE